MKKRPLCMVCLIFLMIHGIFLLMKSGDELIEIPASSIFSKAQSERRVTIQGQVYRKTTTEKVQILYLKNNSIKNQNDSFQESKLIIYDDTFAEIPIGKMVCLQGEISAFQLPRNPGNFNQKLFYAKQGIYGYVYSEKIISISGTVHYYLETLHQLRQKWKVAIADCMSEKNAAVLCAMLLGEKTEIEEEVKELYQKNGYAHVLAISGLHISFLGLGIYQLLRKIGISFGMAGSLSMTLLILYVSMIGFSVSVIRAFVMLLLRIVADMVGRVYDMMTALLFAAAIIVMWQPLYLADAGFYMSHGAVLGILLVLPAIKKIVPRCPKWMEGALSSIAINIALFPILLYFYFEFSMYSIFINMLIIPLMSLVLGLGIFGSLGTLFIPVLGNILLKLCDVILWFFEWIGEAACILPFSRVVLGKPMWWQIMIYYGVLMVAILWLYYMKKYQKIAMAAVLAVSFIFVKIPNGKLNITMIDVGQGDSIFVEGPRGKTYLIDGGSSDVNQVGKYRIEPFLKSQGVGILDYVFVSHGDSDHCNGIAEMIERQKFGVRIKTLVLPANYKEDQELLELAVLAVGNQISVTSISVGETLAEGKLHIECIQPSEKDTKLIGNAGSMVLEVTYGGFDMLFTGDVEEEGEEILCMRLKGKDYDVLKVAHHGSKNSTMEAFLNRVKPKIALISAGLNNLYGHPHEETLIRLRNAGCKIFATTKQGAIRFQTDGNSLTFF